MSSIVIRSISASAENPVNGRSCLSRTAFMDRVAPFVDPVSTSLALTGNAGAGPYRTGPNAVSSSKTLRSWAS